MNEWLSQVYGTGGSDNVDLEKVAQMAILEKLANQEGYDLSQLTEEQAVQLANEVMAAEAGGAPQGDPNAQPTNEELEAEMAKEAQAKFEEADFLGRVMAHAYTQELEKIAAGGGLVDPQGKPGRAAGAIGRANDAADRAVNATGRGIKRGVGAVLSAGGKAGRWIGRRGKDVGRAGAAVGRHVAAHRGAYAAGGLAAGAAGAGIAAAVHHHNKSTGHTKTAFDMLAEKRAAEMLMDSGIDPSTGQEMQGQGQPQGQGNPDDTFQAALDQQAAEILSQNGYEFVQE